MITFDFHSEMESISMAQLLGIYDLMSINVVFSSNYENRARHFTFSWIKDLAHSKWVFRYTEGCQADVVSSTFFYYLKCARYRKDLLKCFFFIS